MCHEVLRRGLSEGVARAGAGRWMCDRLDVSDFSLSVAHRRLHRRLMNHFTDVTNLSASVVAAGIMGRSPEAGGRRAASVTVALCNVRMQLVNEQSLVFLLARLRRISPPEMIYLTHLIILLLQ